MNILRSLHNFLQILNYNLTTIDSRLVQSSSILNKISKCNIQSTFWLSVARRLYLGSSWRLLPSLKPWFSLPNTKHWISCCSMEKCWKNNLQTAGWETVVSCFLNQNITTQFLATHQGLAVMLLHQRISVRTIIVLCPGSINIGIRT